MGVRIKALPGSEAGLTLPSKGRAEQWELGRGGVLLGQVLPWYTGLHGTRPPVGHRQPFTHLALQPVPMKTVPLGLCRA